MKMWLRRYSFRLVSVAILMWAVYIVATIVVALLGERSGTPPRGPQLIPAVTLVGGNVTASSITLTDPHFKRAHSSHRWCGRVASRLTVKRGVYREVFAHCVMTEAAVRVVRRVALPTPTQTRTAVSAPRPTATAPAHTATAVPPDVRTACVQDMKACGPYETSLVNAERAARGEAPLAYDAADSIGSSSCVGAAGHSRAMAQSGTIWHTNVSYPAESFPTNICTAWTSAGQNVAWTPGSNPADAIDYAMKLYLSEPWSPGCSGSHHCNIDSPSYHRIGVGTIMQNGYLFDTQDFMG